MTRPQGNRQNHQNIQNIQNHPQRRRGATLIEVAAATVFTSVLLIPALSLLDQSRRLNERHELREHMAFEAQRLLDLRTAELADRSTFLRDHRRASGLVSQGTLAARGLPAVRYQTTTLADPRYPVAGNEMLTIRVEAWQDDNGNRSPDPEEPTIQLFTKRSRPRT